MTLSTENHLSFDAKRWGTYLTLASKMVLEALPENTPAPIKGDAATLVVRALATIDKAYNTKNADVTTSGLQIPRSAVTIAEIASQNTKLDTAIQTVLTSISYGPPSEDLLEGILANGDTLKTTSYSVCLAAGVSILRQENMSDDMMPIGYEIFW